MVVASLRTIRPIHWIPPIYSANFKLTVERSDGTIDDITDIVTDMKIEDGVTEGIGNFEFTIPNPNETYTSAWTGMEIVRFYCDYASGTPTTLRFRGRVEKPSKKNSYLTVTGRSETLFVHDQIVNKTYESVDAGYALKDLFDTYGESRFDTDSITSSSGTTITLSFVDIPFWDAIEALCSSSGYDCYVDASLVVQFFESGSINNTTDGIVHDHNLLEIGDYADDLQFIVNKVRVVGGSVDGVEVTYTANDLASQTANGIRKKVINDDGILTFDAAKDLAEFNLANEKDAPLVGEAKAPMLATIQPGENIYISDEMDGINPAYYRIITYTHRLESGFPVTSVIISKEPKTVSHVIKDQIQRANKNNKSSTNPDDLDFSVVELFNAETGSHSNTEITDGVLQTTSTPGTWISSVYNTADGNDLSTLRVSIVGDNLPGANIYVSTNDGASYILYNRDVSKTDLTGKRFIIKLVLNDATTQIDSYRVQYSTS